MELYFGLGSINTPLASLHCRSSLSLGFQGTFVDIPRSIASSVRTRPCPCAMTVAIVALTAAGDMKREPNARANREKGAG
jgi:hypothetical protein